MSHEEGASGDSTPSEAPLMTQILSIIPEKLGKLPELKDLALKDDWSLDLNEDNIDSQHLLRAAKELRETDIPVAFPTETVYGLGADATRSSAVRGIYKAKNRPSDNPLIVHVASVKQLSQLLQPRANLNDTNGITTSTAPDLIPSIYQPLIRKFWPGPLTLLMPNPQDSMLAPEVTAGLPTFGARMPNSFLALMLIKLTDRPLAAPSANASTKPSPTCAEHVKHDLEGRIATILDGGPCPVGVESTVVDGLSDPPVVLRPGGISIDEIRACPGWENVLVGYKDASEAGSQPRAPGMKYKHYSPKAVVVLYEHPSKPPRLEELDPALCKHGRLGIIRTRHWPSVQATHGGVAVSGKHPTSDLPNVSDFQVKLAGGQILTVWEINLGAKADSIARGLFAALRNLDICNVDAILVEGIAEATGEAAAAIMNRLRKASEVNIHSTP